jgi:hypothetical protein
MRTLPDAASSRGEKRQKQQGSCLRRLWCALIEDEVLNLNWAIVASEME